MAFNPWIPITELSISYPDFQWGAVANPDEIDINNSEIVGKINNLINKVNERFSATELPYADGSVITRHLLNKSVTSEKLADNSVTTIHITDGSITNSKMQSGCINTDNIFDCAITSPKIAEGSITNSKLEGNIEQSKILDNGYLTTRIDKKIESEIITSGNLPNVGNTHVLKTTQGVTIFPVTIASAISDLTGANLSNGSITVEKLSPAVVDLINNSVGFATTVLDCGNFEDSSIILEFDCGTF